MNGLSAMNLHPISLRRSILNFKGIVNIKNKNMATSVDFYRPQRSWGKVMFLHVCVILFTGGCYPSIHCRWYPSMPCSGGVCAIPAFIASGIPACLAAGGCLLLGGLLLGGVAFCYSLLLWSSVMAFWFGGLLIEGGLLVWSSGGQKATTPEDHHTRRP